MNEVQAFTQWVYEDETEQNNRFVMRISRDYPEVDWTDDSGMTDAEIQHQAPVVVRGFVDDTTALEADPNYLVIWKEVKNRLADVNLNKLMTDSDVQKLGNFLRDVTGLTNQEIADDFNTTPSQLANFIKTKTRAEVVELLKAKWRRLV